MVMLGMYGWTDDKTCPLFSHLLPSHLSLLPMGRVVALQVSAFLEMPKSAILATMSSFSKMFWGLRSRCTTACLHECKNRIPSAI